MAFVATSLALLKLGGGSSPDLWSYSTDDSPAVVKGANYFLPFYAKLSVGDFIFVESGVVGVTSTLFVLVVTVCSSTTLTTVGKTVDV